MRVDSSNPSVQPTPLKPYAKGALSPEQLANHPKRAARLAARLDKAEIGADRALAESRQADWIRKAAAHRAQSGLPNAQLSTAPAQVPATSESARTAQASESPLDALLRAYGAAAGDARYDASLDLDADGVIGFSDLNALLSAQDAQSTENRQFNATDLDTLLKSFNTRQGQQGFDPQYDLNSDGVIDFADLNSLLDNLAPGESSTTADFLTGLLSAFNSREGQESYSSEYDLDGDGHVSFADLNTGLDKVLGGF